MLISSMLGAAALVAVQGDPVKAPRDAFGQCLQTYVDKAVSGRTSKSEFARQFAKQCASEEKSYREAIRAKEAAMKTPADQIEEFVSMEVEDLRANWQTRFESAGR